MTFELGPESAPLTVREACKKRMPLDGADAQALEGALQATERERDELKIRLDALTEDRDAFKKETKALDVSNAALVAERDRLRKEIGELATSNLATQHRAAEENSRLRALNAEALTVGQRFRIPDLHGGYAVCCKRPNPAVYEIVEDQRDMRGKGHRCVSCGNQAPNDHTTIQVVEIVEHKTGGGKMMDGRIPVECPRCKGTGSHEEPGWERHPNSFRYVPCETCRGNRILMARAVEIKPIEPTANSAKG